MISHDASMLYLDICMILRSVAYLRRIWPCPPVTVRAKIGKYGLASFVESLTRRCPRYFANRKRPGGGGGYHPPGFLPSRPNFSKIFLMGTFSGSRNTTVILKKFYLYCMTLKIKGQTPFCVTFLISGCKHDTKLILVSILTFSKSWISNMLKKSCDLDG